MRVQDQLRNDVKTKEDEGTKKTKKSVLILKILYDKVHVSSNL